MLSRYRQTKRAYTGKRRRSSSTGAAVVAAGGYKKFQRRFKRRKFGGSKLVRTIKRVNFSMKELKWKDWQFAETTVYHNNTTTGYYTLNVNSGTSTIMPAQGDTSHTRDGNEVYLSGITMRLLFKFFSDRLNGKAIVHVISVPKGQSVSPYENVWDNITGNVMLDPYDKDRVKVLARKVIYPGVMNPGVPTTGKEVTRSCKLYIPLKQKIRFTGDADYTYDQTRDIFLIINAFDSQGSLTTDSVCTVQAYFRTAWRDM